jgi:hypothetical protein
LFFDEAHSLRRGFDVHLPTVQGRRPGRRVHLFV